MVRLVLRSGQAHASLLPDLGARIAQCTLVTAGGVSRALFFPFDETAHAPDSWAKGGLYPLVPFSGRIADAELEVDGRRIHLTPHSASDPHALHGVAQRRAWVVDDVTGNAAWLSYAHEPDAHWPWRFSTQMVVELTPATLTVKLSCRNTDRCAWPAGVGLHPYLHWNTDDRLSFSARTFWPATADSVGLPGPVASGEFRPSHEDWVEQDLTHFYRHWQSQAALCCGATGEQLRVKASASLEHVVLHKPRGWPYLCIEPATHVPNAFNLAAQGVAQTGCRWLEPDETIDGWVAFTLLDPP